MEIDNDSDDDVAAGLAATRESGADVACDCGCATLSWERRPRVGDTLITQEIVLLLPAVAECDAAIDDEGGILLKQADHAERKEQPTLLYCACAPVTVDVVDGTQVALLDKPPGSLAVFTK